MINQSHGATGLPCVRGLGMAIVSLPKAQLRLVEAWAEIHRSELQHDWELLQSGRPPVKIDPLR